VTEADAIEHAERSAREAGYRLDEYERTGVTSDDHEWTVFYRLRPPGRVGGHFTVRVEAAGGVRITAGR